MKPKSLPFIAFEHKRFVPLPLLRPPAVREASPRDFRGARPAWFRRPRASLPRPNFGVCVGVRWPRISPRLAPPFVPSRDFRSAGFDSTCFLRRGSRCGASFA